MPADQFVAQSIEEISEGKKALFFCDLRVKENVQQQIAKVAGEFLPVAIVDRFQHFIGFFHRIALNGIEGLLAVPGAAAGGAQTFHDGYGLLKFLACGHGFNVSFQHFRTAILPIQLPSREKYFPWAQLYSSSFASASII